MVKGVVPGLVLASASPRRRELCQQLGLVCEVMPVDIDETPLPADTPLQFVARMAREKASVCLQRLPEQLTSVPVLGSDTVVEIDGDILGKPVDEAHAHQMLSRLSGTTHFVHTAVAVATADRLDSVISSSAVEFAELDDADIRRYITSGEPMDKAGAYAIQGIAARYVRKLEGSYTGVVGLPLYETATLLADFGVEL